MHGIVEHESGDRLVAQIAIAVGNQQLVARNHLDGRRAEQLGYGFAIFRNFGAFDHDRAVDFHIRSRIGRRFLFIGGSGGRISDLGR
ncbi:hypothetical protein [Sphingopyxis sp. BSNA05]|uniref:hypothetical protein n=1 Tax=Sphingopyxis sp. BSNA05 TaxID=1236614 RepID=UPI0015642B1D|nr:hypothetical protein [Sphingopyxis sp. BSNA05]